MSERKVYNHTQKMREAAQAAPASDAKPKRKPKPKPKG